MKVKLFIGLIVSVFMLSSWNRQKEEDVVLSFGYKECFERGVKVPITVKMKKELYAKYSVVLSGNGISLSKAGPSPDGGNWVYEEFTGLPSPAEGKEVFISVILRDRETNHSTVLYTKSFTSCGNNQIKE